MQKCADHSCQPNTTSKITKIRYFFPFFVCRVKVESGIRLSRLAQVLETISLSLHIRGRVPDLSLCDAIAIGTGGCTRDLLSSIVSVEVALPNCSIGKVRCLRYLLCALLHSK